MGITADPRKRQGYRQFAKTIDGKPYRAIVPYESDRQIEREYALWVAARYEEAEAGRPDTAPREQSPAFDAYCAHYIRTRQQGWTTALSRARQIDAYEQLCQWFGGIRIDLIDGNALRAFDADMDRRGCSTSYRQRELKRVRGLLLNAADEGYHVGRIPKPPRIKVIKSEARTRALIGGEIDQLLAAASQVRPWFRGYLTVLIATGMRPTEALRMQPSWVDRDALLIRIPMGEGWGPKDKEPRRIPIRPELLQWLRDDTAYCFGRESDPNVCYQRARDHEFRAVRKAAGLPWCHQYTMRHTFASHFLADWIDTAKQGDCWSTLGAMLGHSAQAMTREYAHLLDGHLDRARSSLSVPQGSAAQARADLVWWQQERRQRTRDLRRQLREQRAAKG